MQARTSRTIAALTAIAAAAGAALATALPAAALPPSIVGTVTLPADAEADDFDVIAWLPGQGLFDEPAIANVEESGAFTFTGLNAGKKYQVDLVSLDPDYAGGYWTRRGTLVPSAADATAVKPGGDALTLTPTEAAPVTRARVILPADGTFPTWSTCCVIVFEAGSGRQVTMAGNANSGGSPVSASVLTAPAEAAGTLLASPRVGAAAAPTATSGKAQVVPLWTGSLAADGKYTFGVVYFDSGMSMPGIRYYTGDRERLSTDPAKALVFSGGTPKADTYLVAPKAKSVPTITGTAKIGKKLTAVPGRWSVGGTVKYQWLRNGRVIKGATDATYTPVRSDLGAKLSVRTRLRADIAGYAVGVSWSGKTAPVAAAG